MLALAAGRAVVLMLSVAGTEPTKRDTGLGEAEHAAPCGNPLHANVTEFDAAVVCDSVNG